MAIELNSKIQAKFRLKYRTDFIGLCHQAVVKGYRSMMENPTEFKEWKEEKISARLLHEMKSLSLLKSGNIFVGREHHLEDEKILFGEKDASEAYRIDFIFVNTWRQKENLEYFAEAKNLSHKDWQKSTGKSVKAWNQKDYYIRTGIYGLIAGKYKQLGGFLIGYIVNGSAKSNVESLNSLITRKKLEPEIGRIKNWKPIESYPNCCTSKNIKDGTEVVLQHIFLEFDN